MRSRLLRFTVMLAVAMLAFGAIGLADTAPAPETTPIPTTPKPDFSSLKFSLGNWSCVNTSSRRPAPFTTTSSSVLDPTGYWLVTMTHSPKLSWAPAITSVDKITYDSTNKHWVDVYTDDNGGYDVSYSPGWKGDQMVWTDELFTPGPDIVSASPTTQTKVSDIKLTSHNTFKEKSGRSVSYDVVCAKG